MNKFLFTLPWRCAWGTIFGSIKWEDHNCQGGTIFVNKFGPGGGTIFGTGFLHDKPIPYFYLRAPE